MPFLLNTKTDGNKDVLLLVRSGNRSRYVGIGVKWVTPDHRWPPLFLEMATDDGFSLFDRLNPAACIWPLATGRIHVVPR